MMLIRCDPTTMILFDELSAFDKEFRHLAGKYRSLPEDIEEFKRNLCIRPLGASKHFAVLHEKVDEQMSVHVIKARLFCRFLRRTTLRVIYAYRELEHRITFLEIYFKGDKESEDRKRIKDYLTHCL